MYVWMYVCIDILEHSTISVAITAQESVSGIQHTGTRVKHTVHSTPEQLTDIYTGLYQRQTLQSLRSSNTSLALVARANLVGGN